MAHVLKDPQLLAAWAKRGLEPIGSSPAEFSAFLQQQLAINEKLSKSLGLQLD